jgi:hypothetical protein
LLRNSIEAYDGRSADDVIRIEVISVLFAATLNSLCHCVKLVADALNVFRSLGIVVVD